MSARTGPFRALRDAIARHIVPPRFALFIAIMLASVLVWHMHWHKPWQDGLVPGFDFGALIFTLSLWPLSRDRGASAMRRHALENDANRAVVLAITGAATLAILAAIGTELQDARHGDLYAVFKLIVTLVLAWVFANLVFMLHYAHMHYMPDAETGRDRGGFEFPGTPEPDYWDFLYFSMTAGMSFAASDVNVTRGSVRRVVMFHCLLSFVFNIGVLAFSINVLAGAAGQG